ncbi:Spy/CpxP family protein refolding chaperone [Ferrovibrio xuzhouensis]|uniref:Spy/CpxP family protein refolding chaperone n=1 Tax=Ferrovibrio xuzhouensis TaxID=1576914 RepID=A0ABV7VL88_9PROT
MSKFRPLLAAALVTATLGGAAITAAPAVFAQAAAPAAAPADQAMPKPMPHRQHADHAAPGQFIEGRIAFLRTELKVTPQQQPLFDKLADEMRGTAKTMAARHAAMKTADHKPASSLERLERRSAMMKTAAADSDRFLATYKPFYESLSDPQKKTADLLFARFGGMGGPGGMGGGHPGMRRH